MKNHNSNKMRVLLCGTQYGQTYVPAIFQEASMELMGVYARGSDRSRRLAEQQGVPLYDEIDKISESIDIACVAINESIGVPLGVRFLQKGISILLEHPVSSDGLNQLVKASELTGAHFYINSHFSDLPPIVEFIKLAQQLNARSLPQVINISCNSRTLFSTIDILMRCFGLFSYDDLKFNSAGLYYNVTLLLNGTPCTLVYQNWRYPSDDSKDSPLGHHINITYPEGVLTLGGTFGPCLWFPLIASGLEKTVPLYQSSQFQNQGNNIININTMRYWRQQANQRALREVKQPNTVEHYHNPEYYQHLCRIWTRLFGKLGTTTLQNNVHKNIHSA